MILSLVLPVYGVEKYIGRCIESCCVQHDVDTADFEIIIVDDSSPDSSIELASRTLERHPDINYKIVHRSNGGLSAARNTGLEHATGEYVWFIDSDDYIEDNSLSTLSDIIAANPDVEVVTFGHRNVYPKASFDCPAPHSLHNRKSKGIDLIDCTAFYAAWNRIYKRRYIISNGFRFKEGILWEDGEFNLRLLSVTDKHFCSSAILYNYCRRADSISTANKICRTLDSDLYKFDSLGEWIGSHNFTEKEIRILNRRNNEAIIFLLAGLHQLPKSERSHYFNEIYRRKKRILDSFSRTDANLQRLVGRAIFLFPKLVALVLGKKMQRILEKENKLLS